jgi:hypothetical protein
VKAGVLSLRPKAPAIGCSRTVRRKGRLVGTNAPSVRVGDRRGTGYVLEDYPPSEQTCRTATDDPRRPGTAFLQYWNQRVPALVSANRERKPVVSGGRFVPLERELYGDHRPNLSLLSNGTVREIRGDFTPTKSPCNRIFKVRPKAGYVGVGKHNEQIRMSRNSLKEGAVRRNERSQRSYR